MHPATPGPERKFPGYEETRGSLRLLLEPLDALVPPLALDAAPELLAEPLLDPPAELPLDPPEPLPLDALVPPLALDVAPELEPASTPVSGFPPLPLAAAPLLPASMASFSVPSPPSTVASSEPDEVPPEASDGPLASLSTPPSVTMCQSSLRRAGQPVRATVLSTRSGDALAASLTEAAYFAMTMTLP
jgi:hypothetical protein